MLTFASWIDAVFDHAVPFYDRPWWDEGDEVLFAVPAAEHVAHLTRLFEDPSAALDGFADSQIAQGLYYLIDTGAGGQVRFLMDRAVPLGDRLRGVASMQALFAGLFAPRCTPHLSHLSEAQPKSLNGVCYMWWDILPFGRVDDAAEQRATEAAMLEVLRATLALDSLACQEAALHGLGHWQGDRAAVQGIIDAFVNRKAAARAELLAYARAARAGCVN